MGVVAISSSLIQYLRALQYTTFLEDWGCTSVISARAVKSILTLVCLDIYEELMVELSSPNIILSSAMSEHNGIMITELFMVTVYVTHLVHWCHQHTRKINYIKLLLSLSSFVV